MDDAQGSVGFFFHEGRASVRSDDSLGSETSTSGVLRGPPPFQTALSPEAEAALSLGDSFHFPSLVHVSSFTATDCRCPCLPSFLAHRRRRRPLSEPTPSPSSMPLPFVLLLVLSFSSLSSFVPLVSPSALPRCVRPVSRYPALTPASWHSSRLLPAQATSFSKAHLPRFGHALPYLSQLCRLLFPSLPLLTLSLRTYSYLHAPPGPSSRSLALDYDCSMSYSSIRPRPGTSLLPLRMPFISLFYGDRHMGRLQTSHPFT